MNEIDTHHSGPEEQRANNPLDELAEKLKDVKADGIAFWSNKTFSRDGAPILNIEVLTKIEPKDRQSAETVRRCYATYHEFAQAARNIWAITCRIRFVNIANKTEEELTLELVDRWAKDPLLELHKLVIF